MTEDQDNGGGQSEEKPAQPQEPPPPPVNLPDGYYEHSEDPPSDTSVDLSDKETKNPSPRERR